MANHRSSHRLSNDSHQRLWAPWRIRYVGAALPKGCLFCQKASQRADRRNLILKRSQRAFLLLNLYPYNNGHLMVAPYRHVKDWDRLSPEEVLDVVGLMQDAQRLLIRLLHPHGFNIGCNIGRVAGAGVVGHMHVHVVPRWNGDTNFMPVCAGTKVISQSLSELYDRLKELYGSVDASGA